MLCKFCLLLVCLFAFAAEVHNKPAVRVASAVQSCFKQVCPENTFACEKEAQISEDKKQIVGVIRCLGLKGDILKNITTSEPNPFGPNAQYSHYGYSRAYQVTIDSGNSTINNTVDSEEATREVVDNDKRNYEPHTDTNDVETF